MRRGTRAGLVVGGLLLGLAAVPPVASTAAAPAAGAPAGAAQLAPNNGWQRLLSTRTSGQNEYLRSVDVVDGQVWAAGYRYYVVGGATEFRTLIHRVGGGSSVPVSTPDLTEGGPSTNLLSGLSGSSSTDVWAVGYWRGTQTPTRPLVLHYDGASWTANPSPVRDQATLSDVESLSRTDAWAVGSAPSAGGFYVRPYVLHWNGLAWGEVAFPAVPACPDDRHSYLTSVSGTSGSDVWVTGYCTGQAFLGHWDGASWQLSGGKAVPPNSELQDVEARGPADVWAVGTTSAGGTYAALAMRWNGRTWTSVPGPASEEFAGVAVTPGRAVWTVGYGPSAFKYVRSTGWVEKSPAAGLRLYDVTSAPDGTLWSVGFDLRQDADPLVFRRAAPTS